MRWRMKFDVEAAAGTFEAGVLMPVMQVNRSYDGDFTLRPREERAVRGHIIAAVLLLGIAGTAPAQTSSADIERERLRVEQERLRVERERLELERSRSDHRHVDPRYRDRDYRDRQGRDDLIYRDDRLYRGGPDYRGDRYGRGSYDERRRNANERPIERPAPMIRNPSSVNK